MLIYKKVATELDKLIYVICDVCKHQYDNKIDEFETQEFFHIQEFGGYASVFGDGAEIDVDICQHCMKKIFEEHGIKI